MLHPYTSAQGGRDRLHDLVCTKQYSVCGQGEDYSILMQKV